jgi:hypothetical protein
MQAERQVPGLRLQLQPARATVGAGASLRTYRPWCATDSRPPPSAATGLTGRVGAGASRRTYRNRVCHRFPASAFGCNRSCRQCWSWRQPANLPEQGAPQIPGLRLRLQPVLQAVLELASACEPTGTGCATDSRPPPSAPTGSTGRVGAGASLRRGDAPPVS